MCIRDRRKIRFYRKKAKMTQDEFGIRLAKELGKKADIQATVSYTHLDVYKRQILDSRYSTLSLKMELQVSEQRRFMHLLSLIHI